MPTGIKAMDSISEFDFILLFKNKYNLNTKFVLTTLSSNQHHLSDIKLSNEKFWGMMEIKVASKPHQATKTSLKSLEKPTNFLKWSSKKIFPLSVTFAKSYFAFACSAKIKFPSGRIKMSRNTFLSSS